MNATFNTQQALADGYSQDQINQYLTSRQQQGVNFEQQPTQQQVPENKGGLLDWLPTIGSVAGSFTPLGPILGGAAGGAAGKGLQELFGGGGNAGDIVKEGLLGGAGGVAGKALSPLLRGAGKLLGDSLPQVLDKAGSSFIGSQYNGLSKGVARNTIGASSNPLEKLFNYGITNINDVTPKADAVNNLVSPVVRKAIGLSSPVDTGGILDLAKNIAANPAIPQGVDNKLIDFVNKSLLQAHGGTKGSLEALANPSDTFGFIKDLESKISELRAGKSPALIPSSDKALINGYQMLHDELEQRLFEGIDSQGNPLGKGANSILAKGIFTPEQMQQLSSIHPQLAKDVANVSTVGELRNVLEPFVKGSIAAKEAESGAQAGIKNIGQSAKGLGLAFQNPLNLLALPLSSDTVNAGVGAAAKTAAKGIRSLPIPSGVSPLVASTAGQAGVRLPQALNVDQGSQGSGGGMPMMPSSTQVEQMPNMGNQQSSTSSPQENLRKILGISMLARAHTPQDLTSAYSLLFPFANRVLSPQQQETQANAQSGLRALGIVEKTIQQDPLASLKAKLPIIGQQSSYGSAAKEMADVLTRLRTGSALNADEQKFYESQLPQLFDSPDRINYKLNLFRNLFSNLATQQVGAQDSQSQSMVQ